MLCYYTVAKYSEENGLCVFIKRGKDLFVGYKNYELNKTPLISYI
ncbi:MAG: hypothetical protein ABIN15_06625 [candidate division WOR-3 bacterium]